jgi:hypothetical protein
MSMHRSTPQSQVRGVRKQAEEQNEKSKFTAEPSEYDGAAGVPKKSESAPQKYVDRGEEAAMQNHPSRHKEPFRTGGK